MTELRNTRWLLGVLLLTSCASHHAADGTADGAASTRSFGFTNFADTDNDGLPDTRRGVVAKLDDVTNQPSADVRGRTENFYADRLAGDSRAQRGTDNEPAETTPAHTDRKMIYSAAYTVMVGQVDESVSKLMGIVEELGGYLSKRQNAMLTVRVPAAKFQSLIAKVPDFGRVISESMSASDVTNQHTDLTIRLENAEKSRQRLLALLDKAEKMEDIIKIEEALRRLTGDIERIKGQLKLLNNQISYSTVRITFQANAPQAKTKGRSRSRFPWINRLGVEQDLRRFQP